MISTHTLTWSVTVPLYQFISSLWISTHTLTWSVTDEGNEYKDPIRISTHTLTWSVTKSWSHRVTSTAISTHTLTWSVTEWCRNSRTDNTFQLTRSRGAWRHTIICGGHVRNFNSHAHVERDVKMCLEYILVKNFNSHAHVERDSSHFCWFC